MPTMADGSQATIIGSIGVALLLFAFLLSLLRVLNAEGRAYMGLNVVGAAMACYSSYLIGFMPFVVLEGAWALVALAGVGRAWLAATPRSLR
jgi:hypothetical protein